MVEKPNKLRAALIGGVVMGLLSSIPFVNFINLCCCAGAIIGGIIAARTLIKRSPVLPVTYGDGAATGAIAGAIGTGIYLVVGVPLSLVAGNLVIIAAQWLLEYANDPNLRDMLREAIRQAQDQTFAEKLMSALVQWLIFSVLAIGFAALGGVLGVSFFEKRKGQNAGPTPPVYPPPAGPGPSDQY